MDPITIDFTGLEHLKNLGPYPMMIGYGIATLFALMFLWKQTSSAGHCYGESCTNEGSKQQKLKGDAHVAKAVISGCLAFMTMCMTMNMSCSTFNKILGVDEFSQNHVDDRTLVSLTSVEKVLNRAARQEDSESLRVHNLKLIKLVKEELLEHIIVSAPMVGGYMTAEYGPGN